MNIHPQNNNMIICPQNNDMNMNNNHQNNDMNMNMNPQDNSMNNNHQNNDMNVNVNMNINPQDNDMIIYPEYNNMNNDYFQNVMESFSYNFLLQHIYAHYNKPSNEPQIWLFHNDGTLFEYYKQNLKIIDGKLYDSNYKLYFHHRSLFDFYGQNYYTPTAEIMELSNVKKEFEKDRLNRNFEKFVYLLPIAINNFIDKGEILFIFNKISTKRFYNHPKYREIKEKLSENGYVLECENRSRITNYEKHCLEFKTINNLNYIKVIYYYSIVNDSDVENSSPYRDIMDNVLLKNNFRMEPYAKLNKFLTTHDEEKINQNFDNFVFYTEDAIKAYTLNKEKCKNKNSKNIYYLKHILTKNLNKHPKFEKAKKHFLDNGFELIFEKRLKFGISDENHLEFSDNNNKQIIKIVHYYRDNLY